MRRRYLPAYGKPYYASSGNTELQVYDSMDAMLEGADKSTKRYQQNHRWGSDEQRARFIGRVFDSWQDCVSKCKEVWQEGLDTIDRIANKLSESITQTPKTRKRKIRYNEEDGDDIDSDRLRSGDPAFWTKARREVTTGPETLSMFVDVTTSAYMQSDSIFWRGATAIVLADLLENAGYQVEILAMTLAIRAFNNGDDLMRLVSLKSSRQPIDKASLANALSGWCYRTIWFQAYYDSKRSPNEISQGLGIPCHNIVGDGRYAKLSGKEGCRTVVIEQVFNEHAALSLIQTVLEQFQGE